MNSTIFQDYEQGSDLNMQHFEQGFLHIRQLLELRNRFPTTMRFPSDPHQPRYSMHLLIAVFFILKRLIEGKAVVSWAPLLADC